MTFTDAISGSEKYVCIACIGDPIVSQEIAEIGQRRRCSYCSTLRRAVSIEQLAERVDEVYREVVGMAEETPHVTEEDDNPHWRRDGEFPGTIISEMLEADNDEIGTDIANLLSAGSQWEVQDGGDNQYEASDIWEINVPRDPEFRETWSNFCYAIKHSRRFFNEEAAAMLHEILGPLTSADANAPNSAIRVINPGEGDASFYRGREAHSRDDQRKLSEDSASRLGTPPAGLNKAGRMNSAGIPVFYGTFDPETCVAELRCPVGGAAVVGKFEILRPIRVLDLTLLSDVGFGISYFDPAVIRKVAYNRFIRGFHKEIKRAVVPGSETVEYLPTQFVAEYLWSRPEPALDGIIFGSAQISKRSSRNIVLFPRSSVTAPVAAAAQVAAAATVEDADPAAEAEGTPLAERAQLGDGPEIALPDEGFDFRLGDFAHLIRQEPGPEPTLRFLPDSTVIVEVKSIRFKTRTRSNQMIEHDELFSHEDEDIEETYEEDEGK